MSTRKCFTCGDTGHFAADCPNSANMRICGGICDPRTHHIDLGDTMRRCECHPLYREQLKQDRRCPHCHMLIYVHDNAPCGQHQGPGAPDRRPDREHIDQIVTAERTA